MSTASEAAKKVKAGQVATPTVRARTAAPVAVQTPAPTDDDFVTFFAYSEHNGEDDETRLLGAPVVAIEGAMYTDSHGKQQYGEVGALTAYFSSGMLRTDDKKLIAGLDAWNTKKPNSDIRISRTAPDARKKNVITETVTVTQNVLPASIVQFLSVDQLIATLDADFGFVSQFSTHDEIVKEATEAGIIK